MLLTGSATTSDAGEGQVRKTTGSQRRDWNFVQLRIGSRYNVDALRLSYCDLDYGTSDELSPGTLRFHFLQPGLLDIHGKMMEPATTFENWRTAMVETLAGYRRMIDAAVSQLTDDELHRRPSPEINSVAALLRHLGGNLQSRWTEFLTSDGEKPDRDREREFDHWPGDRESLMAYFETGWQAFADALQELNENTIDNTISIRGEPHSIPLAIARSVTHIAYHCGQIMLIARTVHQGDWQWLTIAPGKSHDHNQSTWGSSRSRGVMGRSDEPT